jgi:hypothetical protein
MTDASIRASDDDRERFVAALREAYTEGRLTLDEFEERTSAAYAARTWGALRELTDDLPAPPVLSVEQFGAQAARDNQPQYPGRAEPGAAPVMDTVDLPEGPATPMVRITPDMARAAKRRPRPFGRLLPVVFIWAVIAAGAGASHLAVALAVVFVAVLAIRALSGTRW